MLVARSLDERLQERTEDRGRKRGHDQHEEKPPLRREHGRDLVPGKDEHGAERPEVHRNDEREVFPGVRPIEQGLEDRQVPGRRDGQELRETLDEPQHDRLNDLLHEPALFMSPPERTRLDPRGIRQTRSSNAGSKPVLDAKARRRKGERTTRPTAAGYSSPAPRGEASTLQPTCRASPLALPFLASSRFAPPRLCVSLLSSGLRGCRAQAERPRKGEQHECGPHPVGQLRANIEEHVTDVRTEDAPRG